MNEFFAMQIKTVFFTIAGSFMKTGQNPLDLSQCLGGMAVVHWTADHAFGPEKEAVRNVWILAHLIFSVDKRQINRQQSKNLK